MPSLLLPTASMPLAITAHGVTSCFSETFYRNIAIIILHLSTDRSWQTMQTDIRLKAQLRPSLKQICTSDGYKGDSETLKGSACAVHTYIYARIYMYIYSTI